MSYAGLIRPVVDRVYVGARQAARARIAACGAPARRPGRPAAGARLATGGPGFRAMAPVHEPADASPALRLTSRLGALRHHRGDAHRAAWRAAVLGALPD